MKVIVDLHCIVQKLLNYELHKLKEEKWKVFLYRVQKERYGGTGTKWPLYVGLIKSPHCAALQREPNMLSKHCF